MKKDIIGRDVPDNSLVIVMGRNKSTSKERSMRYGVLVGDAVFNETDHQAAGEMVLVTNLDDEEIAIRDKILDRLAKEKAESAKKKAERNLRIANLVGGIYKTKNGDYCQEYYLYCGKRRVTVYEDGEIVSQETGHFYLSVCENPTKASRLTMSDFIAKGNDHLGWEYYRDHFKVLKSMKKYNEELHQVDVPARIELDSVYKVYKPNPDYHGFYSWDRGVPARLLDREIKRQVIIEDVYC